MGWTDPPAELFASVDYAGLADAWITDESGGAVSFGTETSGSVTERRLPDGRAEVHVRLHTQNALSWVSDFTGVMVFGNQAPDVLAGADAALGNSFLHLRFINTAPTAEGELSDGTLACMHTTQTGLFMSGFNGAVADGFPAEFIEITEGPCEE